MAHDSSGIHDPTRLRPSAFDRIADRIQNHQASKADVDRVKSRKDCEEAPTIVPEVAKDPIEDNMRMRVKVASLGEIPNDFRHLGSGIYKNAHSLWELRTAEDDLGGYVLVRKFEERAVDLRDGGPRDLAESGLASPRSSSIASRAKSASTVIETPMFETGDKVRFPWKGKIAQAVVIMMMPEGNSAMIDRGDGMPEEMSTSEMTKEEGPEAYVDPGHPELADLGPMNSAPNPEAPMVSHESMGAEGEEKEGAAPSSEGSSHPFEHSQSSPEVSVPRANTEGWHPRIEPDSKISPIASKEGFVILALEDDEDAAGYESLPGGMGVTVSDEYDMPNERTDLNVRTPSGPKMQPGYSGDFGDSAPMGEMMPMDELEKIYGNQPHKPYGPTKTPWFSDKPIRQAPPRNRAQPMLDPNATNVRQGPATRILEQPGSRTVPGRPQSMSSQPTSPGSMLPGDHNDPTNIYPTQMRPKYTKLR